MKLGPPRSSSGLQALARASRGSRALAGYIIDLRLMALEKKTAESIKVLQDIRARDPRNSYASLLLPDISVQKGQAGKYYGGQSQGAGLLHEIFQSRAALSQEVKLRIVLL
jgi:hypothetical protein